MAYPPENFVPTPLHLALERMLRTMIKAEDQMMEVFYVDSKKWSKLVDMNAGAMCAVEMMKIGFSHEEYDYWTTHTFRDNPTLTYLPDDDISKRPLQTNNQTKNSAD